MNHIDLAGDWMAILDPRDAGLAEGWPNHLLNGSVIKLPGSLTQAGLGDSITMDTPWTGDINDRAWFSEERFAAYRDPADTAFPCWLQPERYYAGPAWYQREVNIPLDWEGNGALLDLERVHWGSQAWLDGEALGQHDSLSVPHHYEIPRLTAGKHSLTLRIDNRILVPVGPNSHSVSDHTQGNWNGVVGAITLRRRPPVWIAAVEIRPSAARREVAFRVRLKRRAGSGTPLPEKLYLDIHAQEPATGRSWKGSRIQISWQADDGLVQGVIDLDGAGHWDEFNPVLQRLETVLRDEDGAILDQASETFGLRDFTTIGTQFAINGRPVFLRGTLECCIFPKTGYPPTDKPAWDRILRICREHGLNHLRFHSWCPPEAAFQAGDEAGFYFQVEGPSWANQGATIGDGSPLDAWLYAETGRILESYGNHPCFVMMAYGNEPAGERHAPYLDGWVDHFRTLDPRRLYTTAAGWPVSPASDFHSLFEARIQHWGEGIASRINALPPETLTDYASTVAQYAKPVVTHEIGQWCAYPDFSEIEKYDGVMQPKNFGIFRDSLARHHMGQLARDFLMASGKLQTLCYKEEIESSLRTPGLGGFQLLDLHDFPGQGTALVGVLNPFWESKGYVSAAEYRRFCAPTTVLARMAKRYWTDGESFEAAIQVSHYGPASLSATTISWDLRNERNEAVRSGRFKGVSVSWGSGQPLGRIRCDLAGLEVPGRYRLVAGIDGVTENDWDIWLFAAAAEPETRSSIVETTGFNELALAALQAGGRVLVKLPAASVEAPAQIGFSTVFWNTAHTNYQPPHTLGLLCNPAHPVFARFPTESHSDWQWWDLVQSAAAMCIDDLPPGLEPLVRPIDTWFENRRLALLFEARVAGGSLMVTSMDLDSGLDRRLPARQFRLSLLDYLASSAFAPQTEIPWDAICGLVRRT